MTITTTIRQFLQAGRIDELHLAIVPTLLGRGESLFRGLDFTALGYEITERRTSEQVLHVIIGRTAAG